MTSTAQALTIELAEAAPLWTAVGGVSAAFCEKYDLRGRERDVVNALLEGLTNPGIAAKLLISPKTAAFYLTTIYRFGGAIWVDAGTTTLEGNLFYRNTAASSNGRQVVYNGGGSLTTSYNVVDVAYGTTAPQTGFAAGTGDTRFTTLGIGGTPFATDTFAPVAGLGSVVPASEAASMPGVDFNGAARTWPGAPGAVK